MTAPDLVVIAGHPIKVSALRRFATAAGVQAVALLDVGHLTVRGQRLRTVAGDPSALRGFTAPLTARSDALWQSVARGDLVVSFARSHALRHRFGGLVHVRGRGHRRVEARVGAFASLGLPDGQVVVDRRTGRLLGLRPGREVLVSAPRLPVPALVSLARQAFGAAVSIRGARPQLAATAIGSFALSTIPGSYLALYRGAAATCPGLPWTVLAAIGAVETGHGADPSVSSKGAVGPMQFLPSSFAAAAVDGDGDGVADINDPADAIYSAARYLCLAGAGRGGQSLDDAIFSYNHARWYVRRVLRYAVAYAG